MSGIPNPLPHLVETRISLHRWAMLSEEQEQEIKDISKKFAQYMNYEFEYEYYSVFFTKENWLLAKLANPNIEGHLHVTP
jgi:hypothetical protein